MFESNGHSGSVSQIHAIEVKALNCSSKAAAVKDWRVAYQHAPDLFTYRYH